MKNHDYVHCLDYDGSKCPLSCFRAEVTKALERDRENLIGVPISWWAHFKGTKECLICEVKKNEQVH